MSSNQKIAVHSYLEERTVEGTTDTGKEIHTLAMRIANVEDNLKHERKGKSSSLIMIEGGAFLFR